MAVLSTVGFCGVDDSDNRRKVRRDSSAGGGGGGRRLFDVGDVTYTDDGMGYFHTYDSGSSQGINPGTAKMS